MKEHPFIKWWLEKSGWATDRDEGMYGSEFRLAKDAWNGALDQLLAAEEIDEILHEAMRAK